MKKRWHIQTRVLLTLVGMTAAILLAVGLTFNLSVRGYIRSRVASQLASVSESVSSDRRGGTPKKPDKPFDGRPDRITGTKGSAIVLDKTGALIFPLHADAETAAELAAHFSARGIDRNTPYQILSLSGGKYAVSIANDPVQSGGYLVSYVDVTAVLALAAQINILLLITILAATLLSVVLSRRFAKGFSRPVEALSSFARQIGGGDLSPQEFRFHDIEFDALADSMNGMAAALNEAKQKQEIFFQNVSHELRTPLTSIRGSAEGIVYNVMQPENAAKVILAESDKLGGLVEDILYLSRMGKAAPEGAALPIDLRELLSLCVSEQRVSAEANGLTFHFAFDEAPVLSAIREQDAHRLFSNLISNAIRYAGSEIRLTCRADGNGAFVSVADDGPGISPEDLPHIFERFYKGKDGKHGIGLAIAQSVAEKYHGALTAYNRNGAVFEVTFPASSY